MEINRAKTKTTLNFYYEPVWKNLKLGLKTVETRALNPEEKGRYFGDYKSGDLLLFSRKDQKTKKVKEELIYRIKSVRVYKSFDELFKDKAILAQLGNKNYKSAKELEMAYASFGNAYVEKIKGNGLVAWEIEPISVAIPVPEKDLPVKLPKVKSYEPTGTGESPLATISKWVNVKCPKCKGKAKRETNTMPQWAGSSWYYLRYMDSKNKESLVDAKKEKYWAPVDFYVGGAEHATRHLIYARFWHKFLYDIGVVSNKEPFTKLVNQGLILGPDGQKMSKSRGNVANPDDMVKGFGADSLRLYEMFIGPLEDPKPWDPRGIIGVHRFLNKVWNLILNRNQVKNSRQSETSSGLDRLIHQTIKKVTEDIQNFRFNTAISALMILVNEMEKQSSIVKSQLLIVTKLLFPFAPHIAQELWQKLGGKSLLDYEEWPIWDKKLIQEEEFDLVVQINGKFRVAMRVKKGINESDAKKLVFDNEIVKKWIADKDIKKVIFVPNKLINFIV